MVEKKGLAEFFGIETSFKKVSIKQMPAKDKEYFLDCERIESSYLFRKYSGPKNYTACKLKNIKTNRSRIFYFIGESKDKNINDVFYDLIKSCYWHVAFMLQYELADRKLIAKSKDDYEKIKFVFGKHFSELLHEVTENRVEEGLDIRDLSLTLVMTPDTSDKTIKLLLLHNHDKYILETLMKHPAAQNLAAFD